jgi:hypothetical protein
VPTINPELLHQIFEPEIGNLQGRIEDVEAGCHGGISEAGIGTDIGFKSSTYARHGH